LDPSTAYAAPLPSPENRSGKDRVGWSWPSTTIHSVYTVRMSPSMW
jgi:hypothetical protein